MVSMGFLSLLRLMSFSGKPIEKAPEGSSLNGSEDYTGES